MKVKRIYVYIHVSNKTRKIFYVGKGSGRRASSTLSRNKNWHRIVEEEGYRYFIIKYFEEEKEAFEFEILLIKKYKKILEGGTLVNESDGGRGNKNIHSKIVYRADLDGGNIIKFKSVADANESIGKSRDYKGILNVLNSKNRTISCQFQWSYMEYFEDVDKSIDILLNGKTIYTVKTKQEACLKLGIKKTNAPTIGRILEGKNKSLFGYEFAYSKYTAKESEDYKNIKFYL